MVGMTPSLWYLVYLIRIFFVFSVENLYLYEYVRSWYVSAAMVVHIMIYGLDGG